MHDEPPTAASYRHPDAATDAALDWLLRLREDDEADTLAEFARWRAVDPANARAFAAVSATWAHPLLRDAATGVPSPRAAQARRPIARVLRVAAVLALAAGLAEAGPGLWLRWSADHVTAAGERTTVRLPDGSNVTLNTGSAIATDFEGGRRGVRLLAGEAFFEVAHDPAHPFVVATRLGEVRVTGTAFDVHREAGGDEVFLQRGAVELASGGETLRLAPGEGALLTGEGIRPERPDTTELAWLDGRIEIAGAPLGAALAELARYSPSRVIVVPGRTPAVAVSGSFRTADPEAGLRALAGVGGLAIRRLPGGALILY